MKKTLKAITSLLLSLLMFSLIACSNSDRSNSDRSNSEVKNVVTLIDNIGEVTVDSKDDIDNAFEAYNSLEEQDKKSVQNIEKLHKAKKAFEKLEPEYIEKVVADYKYQSADFDYNKLKKFVSEYYDKLNEEQIKIIGCAIGKCKLEELVVPLIQNKMKNPSSFELVSFDPGFVTESTDGCYSSLIKITYRGTNSFGGIVTETESGLIKFNVNFESCTISYVSFF